MDTSMNERNPSQSLMDLQNVTKISNGPKINQDESRLNQLQLNTQEDMEITASKQTASRVLKVGEDRLLIQPTMKASFQRGPPNTVVPVTQMKKSMAVGPKLMR